MRLIKSTLDIEFVEALAPWLSVRALLRTAAADEKVEMESAPFVIDRQKERKRIVLRIRGVGLEQDWTTSEETAPVSREETLKVISGLHSVSEFPKLGRMAYQQIFLEPFELPLHELVSLMKARYVNQDSRMRAATDIALIYDLHEDSVLKNVHMGPMDRAQLQAQYLRWPAENLPETFAFVSLSYTAKFQAEPFSIELLESMTRQATEWQTAEAESIAAELR